MGCLLQPRLFGTEAEVTGFSLTKGKISWRKSVPNQTTENAVKRVKTKGLSGVGKICKNHFPWSENSTYLLSQDFFFPSHPQTLFFNLILTVGFLLMFPQCSLTWCAPATSSLPLLWLLASSSSSWAWWRYPSFLRIPSGGRRPLLLCSSLPVSTLLFLRKNSSIPTKSRWKRWLLGATSRWQGLAKRPQSQSKHTLALKSSPLKILQYMTTSFHAGNIRMLFLSWQKTKPFLFPMKPERNTINAMYFHHLAGQKIPQQLFECRMTGWISLKHSCFAFS